MGAGVLAIIFLVLAGLVVLAALSLIRGIYRAARLAAEEEEFEPFVDFFPPEPVVRTRGIVVAGVGAIVWGLGHVGVGAVWSATGWVVPRAAESWVVAVYVCIAASLTGVGGVMLLRSHAYGRTLVSWGQFLIAVVAFFGYAISLILPGFRDVSEEVRGAAGPLGVALAVYLDIAVILGTLAQRAGKGEPDDTAA